MFSKLYNFFTHDLWSYPLKDLPKWKVFGIKLLRILFITSQGFTKSQIQQGASSLTYYTILSIVPIIALFIGIARGFRLEGSFENWILQQLPEQKEIITKLFTFANHSLSAANQGIILGIGVIILLWSAAKILIYIEFVMNQIWEVQEGRSYARMFSDYLAMIALCPIIIFIAIGFNVYLTGFLSFTSTEEGISGFFEKSLIPILRLIPYLLFGLLFTFLYIFMPNTRVRFIPALIAGLIAGFLYQIVQWGFVKFQIGASEYNAIYGTFAAVPLFLIWVQLSWLILLLGAKIAFAIQNADAFGAISEDLKISNHSRMLLLLRITHYCIKKFIIGEQPPTIVEISGELSIPHSLTHDLILQLIKSDVLSETKRLKDKEESFQPAKSPDYLTIKRVIDMINTQGDEINIPSSDELTKIKGSLEAFNRSIELSGGDVRLKDI